MPLSCYCDEGDDYDWYWHPPKDYQELSTKRCRKCSCGKRIGVGELCTEFRRTREARTAIEERIYGVSTPEAVCLASLWLCEECSDLWFSLDALGFKCVSTTENMRQVVTEYASMEWRG